MARYVAFLRAINVGGHVVKMDALRRQFEVLGFENVETFIASGNVIFQSGARAEALESKIEVQLAKSLGYEVKTFLRTDSEVERIAAYEPFAAARVAAARSLNVGFLNRPLDKRGQTALMTFRSVNDDFHVDGRELYWLCKTGQADSSFSNLKFEKTVGCRSTFRGLNTIRRLAARFAAD